jgi:clostripain
MSATAFLALSCLPLVPAAGARQAEPPRPWTMLWYAAADNNCDGPVLELLDSARKALDDDPGFELLVLVDRHAGYSSDATVLGEDFTCARLFCLHAGSAERLDGGDFFPGITKESDCELDTADPSNLRRFIAWGKARRPARHYGLVIYGHANGESMCPDEESGRRMGIAELTREAGRDEAVDFLALELCAMGGIEIGYQWRPDGGRFGADVMLAVPNSGPSLDWARVLARIRSPGHASPVAGTPVDPGRMSAVDLGRLALEEFRLGRVAAEERGEDMGHEAAVCCDLRAAGAVKAAIDALAVALSRSDSKEVFLEMRGPGPIDSALHYSPDGTLVDLGDLCLRAEECDALSDEVRRAARTVRQALARYVLVSFGMEAYPGFASGKNGVTIVLPPNQAGRWREYAWYSPVQGQESWTGGWDFLRDGAIPANGVVENWFELLDSWFDEAGAGVNGYRW